MKVPRQQGFGLLEAVVAMAIMGSAGLMLFAWLHQELETTSRIRDAEARGRLRLEAMALVARINPAVQAEGELKLSGLELRWRSEAVEPMRTEYDYGGHLNPRWRVGLFRLHLDARSAGVRDSWDQLAAGFVGTDGRLPSLR